MQRRSALILSLSALLLLTGCTSAAVAGGGSTAPTSEAIASTSAESQELDAAAQQAQAWLDAAVVPPGAVRVADRPASFNSYQGWPCTPVAELTGYWTLAGSTVATAANWLQENPPADLVITTGTEPRSEDANLDGVAVGYIPADDSQQGIVYTVVKLDSGIAIRAEVAALSTSATCASLAPGETWGKPGQG